MTYDYYNISIISVKLVIVCSLDITFPKNKIGHVS
jgi:hypothetical protein